MSVAHTSHAGSSSAIARAIAPEPVPTSSTLAGRRSSADLDQQLGLRAGDQHPAVDRQLDPAKALAAEDVGDRLAPQPPPHHLREAGGPDRRRSRRRGRRRAAPDPGPLASARSSSASRRGLGTPAAPSASAAAASASPTLPTVIAGATRGQAAEAAASSRCRFSSAASASVNSLELAAQHAVEVVRGVLDPVVGDPALGKVVGADLLGALAAAHLSFALGGDLRLLFGQLCAHSSRARSTRIARSLFCSWDFSSCIETTIPVGLWVIRTAESVVLTDCPPGPEDR